MSVERWAFQEQVSPAFDSFKARRDENGNFTCGYNNFWLTCMVPPEDADDFFASQLRGMTFAAKIENPGERARFLELCQAHTDTMLPLLGDADKKIAAMLSDETNLRLWEIYKIARANEISNHELFG